MGHSHGPRRPKRSTRVLRREPPCGALKGRHLSPQGEKVLPKGPLLQERPTEEDRANRGVGRPRPPGDRGQARGERGAEESPPPRRRAQHGCRNSLGGDRGRDHACRAEKEYRHVCMDVGRHAGCEPGRHHPSIMNIQGSPPDLPKEEELRRRKATHGEGGGRQAPVGRIHKGGPIHDMVGQRRHGHQTER